ncbi:MAG: hypothetical protein Q8M16_01570 [Pirellulaceae bacterium]|nr:hypothetical protein [Pirellulaceae bacterium]
MLIRTSDLGGRVDDLTTIPTSHLPSPLVDSSETARGELLQLARRWTGQYASVERSKESLSHQGMTNELAIPSVFLSGHQPELFHAGVWFKNFVLAEAAKSTSAVPVNLLIDQDLVKSNSLLVPSLINGNHWRQRVPLDYGGVGLPFEERQVEHPDVLATVPDRVRATALPWVSAELLSEMWPDVLELSRELRGLGYGFAAARHRLEHNVGCRNLEVPLSWVCQTQSFAQFVVKILERLETFVDSYNRCLAAYRIWYGLRGLQRPMPDLVVQESWHELPFWIWTAQQPVRQRLFAKRTNDGWQLSAGRDTEIHVDVWRLELDHQFAEEQIVGFSELQVRLRPRALMTTLYARGVLSQAFLHGIGGALYDQMTDRLAQIVWGMKLPAYAIATATMHLTPPTSDVSTQQRQKLQRYLRDLHFSPERVPAFAQRFPEWIAEKEILLHKIPPQKHRRAWQQQIEQMLAHSSRWLAPEIADVQSQLERLETQLQERDLMTHREWSFVLFGRNLPAELRDLAHNCSVTRPMPQG